MAAKYSDLYISLWFKYSRKGIDDSNALNQSRSYMLRCENPEKRPGNSIEISVTRESLTSSFKLQGGVTTPYLQAQISKLENSVDMQGWNHYAIYFKRDNSLAIALNSQTETSLNTGNENVLQAIYKFSSTCWLGGGDIGGLSIRHLIFAQGLVVSTIDTFNNLYAHSFPAPLDSNVIGFYKLEDSEDIRQIFQSNQQVLIFDARNEPDPVCHCIGGDNQETENYPYIGNAPGERFFDAITAVPYPKIENFSLKVSFQFYLKNYLSTNNYNQELISHQGLWTLGCYSSSQLYATIMGVKERIIFDVSNQTQFKRGQLLFKNIWINYTFGYDQKTAYLIVNDLSQKTPAILTYQFQTPIDLSTVNRANTQDGEFKIQPQALSGLFSGIWYQIGSVQVFNFKMSQDYFKFTQDPLSIFSNTNQYRKNYQTRVFKGQYVSGNQILKTQTGIQFEQTNGPCNQSDPQFKWDGVACGDQQRYLAFNQKSNQIVMESYLRSTTQHYTFETWFKFQGLGMYEKSSLLSIYDYISLSLSFQISIVKGNQNSAFSIRCDPNANGNIKDILSPVNINNLVKANQWMHFSCVSNGTSKQLKAYLYDQETQNKFSSVQENSYTVQGIESLPVRTILGNDKTGKAPFLGFLKEVRFWSYDRSESELDAYRYQTIPYTSSLRNSMIAYLMLNQGTGNQFIDFDISQQMSSNSIYEFQVESPQSQMTMNSAISWIKDSSIGSTPLRLCPPNTVYSSLNCCVSSTFSVKLTNAMYFDDETSTQYVQLNLHIDERFGASLNQPINQLHYQHSWYIVKVNNYGDDDGFSNHISKIQKYIDSNSFENRQVQIPQDMLVITAVYTFKATVKSLIRNYDTIQEDFIIVKPECPQIRLLPKFSNQTPLKVSKNMDPTILKLRLDTQETCNDPKIQTLGIEWSVSTPTSTYQISVDQKTLTFLSFQSQMIFVTVKLSFRKFNDPLGNIEKVSDTLTIEVVNPPIELILNNQLDIIDATKNDIILDPRNSNIAINFPILDEDRGINYTVNCPPYLFFSEQHMASLCKPDQKTGYLKIKTENTAFVNYQPYNFTYTIQSSLLGFSQSKTVTITFYSEMYSLCPKIFFSPRTDYSRNDQYFLIKPYAFLDCQRENNTPNTIVEKFQWKSIQWQVEDYVNPNDFLDIFGLVAIVKRSKLEDKLVPYFAKNITMTVVLNNGTVIKTQTRFSILRSKLVSIIKFSHQGLSSVPFNETMILDATNSYDPDYKATQLKFLWSINEGQYQQINVKKLIITPFDRLTMDLMSEPQLIESSVSNEVQSDVEPIINDNWVNFAPHIRDKNQTVLSKECSIELDNTPNQFYFNLLNMSDIWISGKINTTKCFQDKPSLIKQQGNFYIYQPNVLLSANQTLYQQTQQIKISKDTLNNLKAEQSVNVDLLYLASFLSPLDQDLKYDYIIRSVKINRVQSPIEVRFVGISNLTESIEVGQESSVTLDASDSIDIDNPNSPKDDYTYIWICPYQMNCNGRSKLTITRDDRTEISMNTKGSFFQIGVLIKSSKKESKITYVPIRVIKQDYSQCLKINLEGAEDNVLSIYRDQRFPMIIKLKPEQICADLKILSVKWVQDQGVPLFWVPEDSTSATNQQIRIESGSQLPQYLNQTGLSCQVQYEVINAQKEKILQALTQNFTIKFLSSALSIFLETNQRAQVIYDLSSNQTLIINASKSFDPDNITSNLSCNWTCSSQVPNCSKYANQCILDIDPSGIFVNSNTSEIASFTVDVTNSDMSKRESKNIFVTLIASNVIKQLPICGFDQINHKQTLDVEKQIIFNPTCYPAERGQKFDQNFEFQWQTNPSIQNLVLKNQKLSIPAYNLHQYLSNKLAGSLKVTLKVISKNDPSIAYQVSKNYDIPKFYYGILPKANQIISFEVFPPIVTTLFSQLKITINDFELKSYQYFRIRAIKTLDQVDLLIDQSKNQSYTVYLPKGTLAVNLDIISKQRQNSGKYEIYSIQVPGLFIYEPNSMSKQTFQYQILPRLNTIINPQMDYNDISEVKKQLYELTTLKHIITGIRDTESQPRYNSMMFPRIETLFNNTIGQSNFKYSVENSHQNVALIKAQFTDLITLMFTESCKNNDFKKQAFQYLSMAQEKTLDIKSLGELMDPDIEPDQKASYIDTLNLLSQSSCLNTTERMYYGNLSDQLLISSIEEGDSFQFGRGQNGDPKATLYKLSSFDKESDNILIYQSADNNNIVTMQSSQLPPNATYISYRTLFNGQRLTTLIKGNSYLSSENFMELRILDSNLNILNISLQPDSLFEAQIDFIIQSAVTKQISTHNKTFGGISKCISRADYENSFQLLRDDQEVITNDSMALQGRIKCTSKHLSTFGVIYTPVDITQTLTKSPVQNDTNQEEEDLPIFTSIPLLKYLLPALFVVIILVLTVLGLIMSQMEFNRPKRFYNKLSLTENLQKYTFCRLLTCMILQFNPIFNYVFKPSFYMSRPLRLLIIMNYFLLVSSICLLYYTWIPPGIRVADIFWLGFSIMIVIAFLRPKLQEIFFALFYPKTLTNWKTKSLKYRNKFRGDRSPNRNNRRYSDQDAPTSKHLQADIDLDEDLNDMSPKKKKRYNRTLFDDEDFTMKTNKKNKNLENSQRLQDSGIRLIDESNIKDRQEEDYGLDHDERVQTRGDEIINFRDQKNRSRVNTQQSAGRQKQQKGEESTVKRLFNKIIKNNNDDNSIQQKSQQEEVELTEIKQQLNSARGNFKVNSDEVDKKDTTQQDSSQADNSTDTNNKKTSGLQYISSFDRQSREMLRSSIDSNLQLVNQREYADFKFENTQFQEAVHIDIENSRADMSQMDIDTSKDELNRDSSAGMNEEYYFGNVNDSQINRRVIKKEGDENLPHYEGGEDEEQDDENVQSSNAQNQENYNENEESESPDQMRDESFTQKASDQKVEQFAEAVRDDGDKPHKRMHKRKRGQNQVTVGFNKQSRHTAEERYALPNNNSPEVEAQGEYQDESTPSLESIYKNYRELKAQDTSKLKRFVGFILFLFISFGLLVLHVSCLTSMKESQFSNWISCTMFTFMLMIFGIDIALYALVAWALKRTKGKVDRRKYCSLINLLVHLPLGRWKFLELEIELAKMKDFDKDYGLLAFA